MTTLRMPHSLVVAARHAEAGRPQEALDRLARVDFDRFYRRRSGRVYAEAFAAHLWGFALVCLDRETEALPYLHQAERDLVWPRERIIVLRMLGHIAVTQWRLDDGLRYTAEAIGLIEAQPVMTAEYADHWVNVHFDRAACLTRRDDREGAIVALDRAYAVIQGGHLPSGWAYSAAAWCLSVKSVHLDRLGRPAEALTTARTALVVGRRSALTDAHHLFCGEIIVAWSLTRMGRRAEGLEVLLRLVEVAKEIAERYREPEVLADVLTDVAQALTECGRVGEAWAFLDNARDILDRHCEGRDEAGMVRAAERKVRAQMVAETGDRAAALALYGESLELGHGCLRPGEPVPRVLKAAAAARDRLTGDTDIDKCQLVR